MVSLIIMLCALYCVAISILNTVCRVYHQIFANFMSYFESVKLNSCTLLLQPAATTTVQ